MKILERIGIVFYIVGLIAFPVYKAFIEPEGCFESITSILSSALSFVLYFIGWWFLFSPAFFLVTVLFWPGEVGKEARSNCLIYLFILILPLIGLYIWGLISPNKEKTDSNGIFLKSGQFYDSQEEETGKVWICLGKSSHAYHSTDECYGIQACKGEIECVSIEDAISMGRTPCHYCHEEGFENDDCEDCYNDEDEYDPDRNDNGVYIINGQVHQ